MTIGTAVVLVVAGNAISISIHTTETTEIVHHNRASVPRFFGEQRDEMEVKTIFLWPLPRGEGADLLVTIERKGVCSPGAHAGAILGKLFESDLNELRNKVCPERWCTLAEHQSPSGLRIIGP